MSNIQIVSGIDYLDEVKKMIAEYYELLGRDLAFQNIDSEFENPLVKYSSPVGELLVAIDGNNVLGVVAYHQLNEERCEMKRLFVRPAGRGRKIGEDLSSEIIRRAKLAGYKEMVLDTIVPLTAAIHLYKKLGFKE